MRTCQSMLLSNLFKQNTSHHYQLNSKKNMLYRLAEPIIQPLNFAYVRLLDKPYENEVTLTGQNPPLKCCHPLEILKHFITGLDLSMIEIWSLWVKVLQNCWPSNFENGLTPVQLESGPIGSTRAGAMWQTF